MKRIFLRVLVLLAAVTLALPAMNTSAAPQFSDVNSSYWAHKEITFLANQQIVRGKDGKFNPESPLKRMQAAEIIVRALGLSTENRPNPNFKDIKPGDYGYEYAATLADEGIMTGNNGYFKPWDTLTRGQMAKILSEAYGLTYAIGSSFDDVDYDDWLYDYVSCLVDNHITTGYKEDNTFRPNAPLKRSQFSAFMARVMDDSFKPAVLFNAVDYSWDQDGGLTLTVEAKNNFSYAVEVTETLMAVTVDDELITFDLFLFGSNELYLQAGETKQIELYFEPDYIFIEPAELTNIVVFTQSEIVKR